VILDCRGRRCPLPVIELARHITDVEVGELIEVDSDDPAASHDIAAWCRMRGHRYLGPTAQPDGAQRIAVRRQALS
jgi:tRNA 2-thiouridine synthesizing protein A